MYREAYQKRGNIPTARRNYIPEHHRTDSDILIPARGGNPDYHQRTNAFPFTVAPGKNQSMWIDVHIPPASPSGYYSGTVTVQDGAAVVAVMPVQYVVWDWEMPSTASLPSFTSISYGGFCLQVYGRGAGCAAYPGAQGISDYGAIFGEYRCGGPNAR